MKSFFKKKKNYQFCFGINSAGTACSSHQLLCLGSLELKLQAVANPLATSMDSGNHSSPLEEQQVLPTNALSLQPPISFLKFCTLHACRACGGLQRASDALELEL